MRLHCTGCDQDVHQRECDLGKRWHRERYVHVKRKADKGKPDSWTVCGEITMIPDENTARVPAAAWA